MRLFKFNIRDSIKDIASIYIVSIIYIVSAVLGLSPINVYADEFAEAATESVSNSNNISNSQDQRIWNLDDVDILALIGEVSRVTGRNFVIDPRVSGKASLVSNEPMSNEQAYAAFQSILQVLGFAVVDSGPVSKIVPSSVAKQYDTKVNSTNLKSLGDEMVVQVIPVKHVTATALIPVLRNLVNQQGHIVPYSPSNVIIIADHASNVARITEIVNRIDQENSDDVEIISLKDASAEEVVKVLTQLLARGQQLGEPASQQVKLAADSRTNSVLLSGDKSKRLKTRALIAQMDVPTPRTGDTEVIYLQYQNAEDLVPVIATVIDAYYNKKADSQAGGAGSNRSSSGGGSNAGSYSSSSSGSSSGGSDDTYKSSFELGNVRRGEEGNLSAPGVRAEPNTNAIVITAPQELMRSIKSVISKLDIRRYQVMVEALIVEVSMNHALNLGVEWRLPGHNDGAAGGANFGNPATLNDGSGMISGITDSFNTTSSTSRNLDIPIMQSLPLAGVTVGFLRGGNIRALVNALGQDTNTNILSTPSLVTMDNETAEIAVTQQLAFKTADFTSTSSSAGDTRNSFEYKDVGIKLKITPMVTKGDAVKLAVEQVQGNVQSNSGNTPVTSNRSIKTVVIVDNKDVLVLGGLIQGQKDHGEQKIPILGDIPVIGNLFKRKVDNLTKRNLMVFIRPVIIRTSDQSHNVSISKYDLMRDSQLLHQIDPYGKMAKEMMPQLPDLANNKTGTQQDINLPTPFTNRTFINDVIEHEIFQ